MKAPEAKPGVTVTMITVFMRWFQELNSKMNKQEKLHRCLALTQENK